MEIQSLGELQENPGTDDSRYIFEVRYSKKERGGLAGAEKKEWDNALKTIRIIQLYSHCCSVVLA